MIDVELAETYYGNYIRVQLGIIGSENNNCRSQHTVFIRVWNRNV